MTSELATPKPTRVVVIGGGFGGLAAAKGLSSLRAIDLTLVDRRNYHLFQPLLYQVATAGLSPAEIATPIRSVLSNQKNTRVLLAEVQTILPAQKQLALKDGGTLDYDFLIIAAGASHSYFGHENWETFAPGLKTLEQATEIRRRILLAFENAERESDPEIQKALLTFVIVGGGPTGVELAGAIAEISRHTLERDFRNIDPTRTRVVLVEAGARLLAAFDSSLSKRAAHDLEQLGVQIWTQTRVSDITDKGVALGKEFLQARTVVWAAGVKPSSLSRAFPDQLDAAGRIQVQPDLSVPGFPEVFVIGDLASFKGKDGKPLPGLAPVALQQGRHVAKVISASIQKTARPAFVYLDKGQMATIGRRRAIVQFRQVRFAGFFAWCAWLLIHIYYLIGFKNRLFVLYDWAWSYMTFSRGARLIMDKEWKNPADLSAKDPAKDA